MSTVDKYLESVELGEPMTGEEALHIADSISSFDEVEVSSPGSFDYFIGENSEKGRSFFSLSRTKDLLRFTSIETGACFEYLLTVK